ncbi:hypothetical protein ACOMHN_058389 [Nucella lapillus]
MDQGSETPTSSTNKTAKLSTRVDTVPNTALWGRTWRLNEHQTAEINPSRSVAILSAANPARAPGMEGELKRLLQDEAGRRQRFIGQLLDLLMRWKRMAQGGRGEGSMESLVKDLQTADDLLSPLLLQCRDLCLHDLSRKEKRDTGEQRDSGFTSSLDLGAVKRQGMCVAWTAEQPEEDGCQETQPPLTPESDKGDNGPLPEPTQNTDESSDADSASS